MNQYAEHHMYVNNYLELVFIKKYPRRLYLYYIVSV